MENRREGNLLTLQHINMVLGNVSDPGGVPFPTFSISPIRVVDTEITYVSSGPAIRVGIRLVAGVDGFEKLHDQDVDFSIDQCPNQPQWMDISSNAILYAARMVWEDPDSTATKDPSFVPLGVWKNTNSGSDFFILHANPGFIRYVMQIADSGDLTTILGQATYTITQLA